MENRSKAFPWPAALLLAVVFSGALLLNVLTFLSSNNAPPLLCQIPNFRLF